ncbi:response regulator [Pseudoflavonifractor sp.]|jgi:DNA-binding NarL/FixJ family response regulator|uniref:response regulator n=1 Tax=Pseudoflavonifractor sp. TaxID=1980281 RepID=UPI003D8C585B
MMEPIRILVVEDDPDFQYLIQQSLSEQSDFALIACCQDGESAFLAAVRERPDVVLMDLALPTDPVEGVMAARRIRLETRAKVILLTSYEEPETVVRASVEALASAYVLKSQFPLLVPTIRETARGVTPQSHLICSALLKNLTPAEMSVFRYMLGTPVTLHSSEKTIANQQTSVLHKLGLQNKQQLRHVFAAYFPQIAEATGQSYQKS